MARKKRSTTQILTKTAVENESSMPIISSTAEKDLFYESLRTRLAEISQLEGVTGYIIRNATSATIDLKDPSNLIAFALLSSHAADSGHEFSKMFDLGEVKNILVEGQDAKVLCVTIGENLVNIFMEKMVDHCQILKQILH